MKLQKNLYIEIVGGEELVHVIDIIQEKDNRTCGDLFYDLQILHSKVKHLSEENIIKLCDYVDSVISPTP